MSHYVYIASAKNRYGTQGRHVRGLSLYFFAETSQKLEPWIRRLASGHLLDASRTVLRWYASCRGRDFQGTVAAAEYHHTTGSAPHTRLPIWRGISYRETAEWAGRAGAGKAIDAIRNSK